MWVAGGGVWQGPLGLTADGAVPVGPSADNLVQIGAPVSVAHQGPDQLVRLFYIDQQGALRVCWVGPDGIWQVQRLTPDGTASPMTTVALAPPTKFKPAGCSLRRADQPGRPDRPAERGVGDRARQLGRADRHRLRAAAAHRGWPRQPPGALFSRSDGGPSGRDVLVQRSGGGEPVGAAQASWGFGGGLDLDRARDRAQSRSSPRAATPRPRGIRQLLPQQRPVWNQSAGQLRHPREGGGGGPLRLRLADALRAPRGSRSPSTACSSRPCSQPCARRSAGRPE